MASEKKDTTTKKKANTKVKKPVIKLNKGEKYKFKANSKAPYMLDGKVYSVTGEIAEILVGKSYGEIVK